MTVSRVYAVDANDSTSYEQESAGAEPKTVVESTTTHYDTNAQREALQDQLESKAEYYRHPTISGRVQVPNIVKAYLLGDKITEFEGRMLITPSDSTKGASVVGVQLDLVGMNTNVSLETETSAASALRLPAARGRRR